MQARDGVLLEGKLDEYQKAFDSVDTGRTGVQAAHTHSWLACAACEAHGAHAGKIGATQIAQLFEHLGHPLTYERLVEIMAQTDKQHKGKIEFGDFLRMFRSDLLDLKEVQWCASEPAVADLSV